MSKLLTGKNLFIACLAVLLAVTVVVILTTCNMPVGLGSIVNTDKPEVGLHGDKSLPGAFLQGSDNVVWIDVRQDFGVDEENVYMEIEFIPIDPTIYTDPDYDGPEVEFVNGKYIIKIYAEMDIDDPDSETYGKFSLNIDTTNMVDGQIRANIYAADITGNVTRTTDIIYFVKNRFPQIELSIPLLKDELFDNPLLNNPDNMEIVLRGNPLMGIAEDAYGLFKDYPKIMIWPAPDNTNFNNVVVDDDGIPVEGNFWHDWYTVKDNKGENVNKDGGLNATQFRWPLTDFSGQTGTNDKGELNPFPSGEYRFIIEVKDMFGTVNRYPNRSDYDSDTLDPDNVNKYISIRIIEVTNPIITWQSPFPQFYNGQGNYEVEVTVITGNPPSSVYAKISDNDEIDWGENLGEYRVEPITPGGNKYLISLSSDRIEEMLGHSNISGDKVIHVKAIDGELNESNTTRQMIIDTEPPQLQFIEPLQDSSATPIVTSTVIIRGSVTDNQRVGQMWYALGKKAIAEETWINTELHTHTPRNYHDEEREISAVWSGTISSWTWRFENIAHVIAGSIQNDYVDPFYDDPELQEQFRLFYLPIRFMFTDSAGNVNYEQIRLIVDPQRDIPIVTVNSHVNSQTVGGPIRINGTAEDNELIHSVEMRIYMQDDDECYTDETVNIAAPSHLYKNPDLLSQYTPDGWIKVSIPSHDLGNYTSTIAWTVEVNKDNSLNPPAGKMRRVLFQFRAWDSSIYSNPPDPKQYGITTELLLQFDNTVPEILDERIFFGLPSEIGITNLRNHSLGTIYEAGETRVSGKITMRIRVRDDSGIETIRLRSGGTNIDLMAEPRNTVNDVSPWIEPNEAYSDGVEYFVYIPMNTNAIPGTSQFGSGFRNEGRIFNMTLQVLDDTSPAPYMTQNGYSIEIDNRFPLASYTGYTFARDTFKIEGQVWDTGDSVRVQGVERIVVYLTRGGQIINLRGASINTPVVTATTQRAWTGRVGDKDTTDETKGEIKDVLFPIVETDGSFISTNMGIVIDGSPLPDIYRTSFSGTTYIDWAVEYDTTGLTDGKYMLNYVAFDKAGNATHYDTEIYIANNVPVITKVNLGTDINGSGAAGVSYVPFGDGSSSIGNSEITTNFRIRNNRFNVGIETQSGKGNGNKNYRVSYVTRSAGTSSYTTIEKGNIYEIQNTGNNINWANYGVFGNVTVGTTFVAMENHSQLVAKGMVRENESGGMVYQYIPRGGVTSDQVLNQSGNSANIGFTSSAFGSSGSTALIPESENIHLDAEGNVIWDGKDTDDSITNKRLFLIHVYDSTVPDSTVASDQLSHVVIMNVGINNIDSFAPRMELAAIGEKFVTSPIDTGNYIKRTREALEDHEYNQNIVTTLPAQGEARKGYVQYAAHNGTRADLSGMVIFKGKAMDNGQVRRIIANIPGFNPNLLIASWNSTTNRLESAVAGNTIATMRSNDAIEWGFETIDQEITMEYGHVLNWNFAFDTSKIETIVAENITITFTAYDADTGGNASTPVSVNVNIVPYITDVITTLTGAFSSNPTSFSRSALGWYPVRENTEITIKGFNFGSSSTTSVFLNETELTASTITNNEIVANIGASAISGELIVEVNEINSINNETDKTAHYNQEGNNNNNDKLNDSRNLYVWSVGSIYTPANAAQMPEHSFMRMSNSGRRLITYATYATNGRLRLLNNHAAIDQAVAAGIHIDVDNSTNRYLNLTVAVDSANDWFIASSNMTANQSNWTLLHARAATANAGAQNAGTNKSRIINLGPAAAQTANRVRIPRLFARQTTDSTTPATTGNNAMVLMSYGDDASTEYNINLHYGIVSGGGTAAFAGNFTAASGAGASAIQQVTNATSTYRGSMYTAVASLSDGRPVISWYDRRRQSLIFSYGNNIENDELTTTSTNTEFVYTAAGHGFTGGTNNENLVLIRPSTEEALSVENLSINNLYHVTRRISADKFAVMPVVSSVINGFGTDAGENVRIVRSRVLPVTAVRDATAGSNAANGRNGIPGNFTQTVRTFTLPTGHGLRLGDQVVIIHGDDDYVSPVLHVSWMGNGTAAGNGNDVAFRESNANWVAAGTDFFNGRDVNTTNLANMYLVLISRENLRVTSVVTSAASNSGTSNDQRFSVPGNQNVITGARMFVLSPNHGIVAAALGETVSLVAEDGFTYNDLRIVGIGRQAGANVNSIVLRQGNSTYNNALINIFGSNVASGAIITAINPALSMRIIRSNDNVTPVTAARSEERYYTYASHGFNVGQSNIVINSNNDYNVAEVFGNNFKIADSSGIANLGTGNITITIIRAGNEITTTGIGTWQDNAVEIKPGAGTHVDLAVDDANNVHLAYYDVFNGGLYYTFIPSAYYSSGATIETVKVDTYLSAGTKIMINVRNESTAGQLKYVPYISYFHSSFAETVNSIRVAWPVTAVNSAGKMAVLPGTDINDRFTGNWEVMTVPAVNIPASDSFVSNGVPTTNTNWVPLTGTEALSGYWSGSNTQANSRINRSILVGYMTNSRYEGAVLKKDLWTPDP